jgi:hypothetical protein
MQPDILDLVKIEYSQKALDIQKMFFNFIKESGSIAPENDLIAISSLIKGAHLILITTPDFFQGKQFEDTIIDACFRLIQKGDGDSRSIQSQKAMQNEAP